MNSPGSIYWDGLSLRNSLNWTSLKKNFWTGWKTFGLQGSKSFTRMRMLSAKHWITSINEVSEKRDSQLTTLNNSTKSVEQSTESHDRSAGGTANSSRTVYERKSLSINHSMLNEYLTQTQSNNAQSEDSGVKSHGWPSTSTVKPASSSQNQSLTCDICKQDGIKSLSGMGRHKKGKKRQQAFAAAHK